MRSPPPRPLLLAFALTAAACPLPPDFVGETLPERTSSDSASVTGPETGMSVTTVAQDPTTTTTGGTTATSDETGASTTAGAGAYGSFCELVGAEPDLQRTVIVPQPACDGGICLLVSDGAPLACMTDVECADEAEGSVCAGNGLCNLSPAFIEANARCTRACETDDDCPAVPGCADGLRCAPITLTGDLCCQRVCACKDHLSAVQANEAEVLCTQPRTCG
ncbi:hypothetical protein SAMN02745121_03929 [Nannocystis exedens]|uniref:Uncharacterized protein n=1 Tax=Nannocystis exedens TaxID=54 RepID=A0A1I1ZS11_9BACT|nr:hypothetical protein [Nannocystis exedens]SFE34415.1 hypothetical protein SAMN02745121_03929 [Nannocystis exedens]